MKISQLQYLVFVTLLLVAVLAVAAVKKLIAQEEYPVLPTIGKIRKAAQDLCDAGLLTASEAWGQVLSAVHKYGYYREGDALESMAPEVARVVGWMGWQELCHSDNIDVVRGQFIKMFDTDQKRQRDLALMPPEVRKYLQAPQITDGKEVQ